MEGRERPVTPGNAATSVLDQLAVMDALFASIREVVGRHDPGCRRLLVDYRRQLATGIADLGTAGSDLFTATADEAEFRRRLSDFRYRLAYHQASWPAVAIDDSDDYRRSSLQLLDAYDVLAAWTRSKADASRATRLP